MASRNCKGRHLSWSICQSEQVADLSEPWAKLLFTWLIPNADNCGRLEGEPYQVAGLVFPLEMEKGTVSVGKVERWLQELHDSGLIIWYRSGRLRYIALPKFSTRQNLTGNMKATSDYPAPEPAEIEAWQAKEQAVQTTYGRCIDGVCTEAKAKDKDSFLSDARTAFGHWQRVLGHPTAKFTEDRKQKIIARLREGTTVERLCQAIDGCAQSKYHMGENPQGRRYDSVELIFRTAGKVDEFADMVAGRSGTTALPEQQEAVVQEALALCAAGEFDRAREVAGDLWEEVKRRG